MTILRPCIYGHTASVALENGARGGCRSCTYRLRLPGVGVMRCFVVDNKGVNLLKQIAAEIARIKKQHPGLRIMQVLINSIEVGKDPYYYTDAELLKALRDYPAR